MEYKSDILDERVVYGTTNSGLKYYIFPKKGFNFKGAVLAVNYGSKDIFNGSPMGTAHFIEHRLFQNKEGNAFDDFVKMGADANAFTDFNKTAYYFYTAGDFYAGVDTLIGFVTEPYFEKDDVERERDIIKQEISMYGDDPYWKTYFDCIGEMYPVSTLQEIAGTHKSVEKINEEILYRCYDEFYLPENMCLVCAGDIDEGKIIERAERIKGKKSALKRKNKPYKIEGGIATVRKMDLAVPAFSLGLPIEYDEKCNSFWFKYRIKVMMDIIAGNASRVYNSLYNSGVIREPLGFDYLCGDGYAFAVFTGQTKEYDKVAESIKSFISDAAENGFDNDDFENCRRKACGRFIRGFNSIDSLCMAQTEMAQIGNILEAYDEFSKMTKEELDIIIKKYFDVNKAVLSAAE